MQAARDRSIDADLVAVRAHWGYYEKHIVVERLHQDVILPARAKGYRHIWFVGISLGGWGSLQYVRQHAKEIEGMLLLAPFLGEKKVFDEVHCRRRARRVAAESQRSMGRSTISHRVAKGFQAKRIDAEILFELWRE